MRSDELQINDNAQLRGHGVSVECIYQPDGSSPSMSPCTVCRPLLTVSDLAGTLFPATLHRLVQAGSC